MVIRILSKGSGTKVYRKSVKMNVPVYYEGRHNTTH